MTGAQIKDLIKLKEEEIYSLKQDLASILIKQTPHKIGDVFINDNGYLKRLTDIGIKNEKLVYYLSDIEPYNGFYLRTIHTMEYDSDELPLFKIGTAKLSEDGSHIISLNINYQNNKQC